ncbi:hypothetical protein Desor_2423 [Desulfosporosinus orientis DSM 765]|uniref:Fe-S oxidoreductase n=1 Tax=Desulfosporosinus orientis (strain ATCC 19365 / DSM 765 / NCIMB 8382 / VKM B-1628 / Singapore I) TaxID=768706 RepID=G7WFB1_DESOD|nr:hypothetical protein [Desulfosporosinus orientis]AET67997.1 hypothetical protein Desor_2423 [Desulfosporosinus orientis DSM 765]
MQKILLLEPKYKNKYPPMGLMKLATYYRSRGNDVRFFKGNLKEFAASLLCEEYLLEVCDSTQAKYTSQIFQFIKTGQYAPIDAIPGFRRSDNESLLKLYRKMYKDEQFPQFDVICITTLFTFYWGETVDTINYAKKFLKKRGKILVGGIAASIMPDKIYEDTGVKPNIGLLNVPGILDNDSEVIIDELPLDYSILEEIDYKYPASNAYFAYMTRGCTNRCAFCAVPRLEPYYCNYISLKPQLEKADDMFGAQKDLLLMDNNVFASERFDEIIDEIKACGFGLGATYTPPSEYEIAISNLRAPKKERRNIRAYTKKMIELYDKISERLPEKEQAEFYLARENANLLYAIYATRESILEFDTITRPLYEKHFKRVNRTRYIDFNQGIDARLVTNEKMRKLSEVNIRPLRIAFDHYSMKDTYIKAVKLAAKYNIKDLSNYLLYNYDDKPEDLYERMKLNVELCEELGVTIYSFPMKYHPIDDPDYFNNRDYIGIHWNRKFIRAIQAVLNATKGKIGRGKTFFEEAFGCNVDEFRKILWMPEAMIIYRYKYDQIKREQYSKLKGKKIQYEDECDLTNEWWQKFKSLTDEQSTKLKKIVSKNHFTKEDHNCSDAKILEVLEYYKLKRD